MNAPCHIIFVADVEMKFNNADAYLENTVHNTNPIVIHGNGPSKRILNSLGNYLPKAWNTVDQVRFNKAFSTCKFGICL